MKNLNNTHLQWWASRKDSIYEEYSRNKTKHNATKHNTTKHKAKQQKTNQNTTQQMKKTQK